MRTRLLLPFVLVTLAQTPRLLAQSPSAPDCSNPPALPSELLGWTARTPLAAAKDEAGVGAAALAVGRGVDAKLPRTSDVKFATLPERPGGSLSYGGMFGFEIDAAGTYRVGLSSGAWIDVLEAGSPVVSSAHGHGPDCSGVRKLVAYPLKPGHHVLQLSGNADRSIGLIITRDP